MESGIVKAAADVRDVGQRIKIAEDTDAIDQHDVTRRVGEVEVVEAKTFRTAPGFDRIQMRAGRFVRRDDEAKAGKVVNTPAVWSRCGSTA